MIPADEEAWACEVTKKCYYTRLEETCYEATIDDNGYVLVDWDSGEQIDEFEGEVLEQTITTLAPGITQSTIQPITRNWSLEN